MAFADVVDTRTPLMGRHGRRVAAFAVRTGTELGFDANILTELRRAALLHDIGKLLVPIATLEKPAELTDAERKVVDEHARAGAAVLAVPGPSRAGAAHGGPPRAPRRQRHVPGGVRRERGAGGTRDRAVRPLRGHDRRATVPGAALTGAGLVDPDEVVGEPMARIALSPPACGGGRPLGRSGRGRGGRGGMAVALPVSRWRYPRSAPPPRMPGTPRSVARLVADAPVPRPDETRDDRREIGLAGMMELDAHADRRGQRQRFQLARPARSTARKARR